MIIGVSGYARSGKDEIANVLLDKGFERAAFADTLRKILFALNPLIGVGLFLRDAVNVYGWEEAKDRFIEIRRLLQQMGTEAGRDIFGQDIWVERTFSLMDPTKNYVITDVRFKNEADAIREMGGQMWRVVRPDVGPVNSHSSERGLEGYKFDYVINNDKSLQDLRILVNAIVSGTMV